MKSQARAAALTAFVLALAVTSLSALRGQQHATHAPKQQQADDSPLPVVDYSDRSHEKDAKRRAKGKRYDDDGAVQTEAWKDGIVAHTNDWEVRLPALPVGESNLIVVGTVLDVQAHLSPANTGVYSEFSVKVDEVLKDSAASVSTGDLIAVDREGGRVRYPSGSIVTHYVTGQGVPRPNKRYVLFLKRGEENLTIVTGYELHEKKVRPLDHPKRFKKFEGASEDAFLNEIRSAINSAAHPGR
jgi:hypothetical protein